MKTKINDTEVWINSNKFKREKLTIEKMLLIFCYDHHSTNGKLCLSCSDLLNYCIERIKKCPHTLAKPRCAKCNIHCYQKSIRDRMKEVMKYSGPRMVYRHPWLTIMHYSK